MLWQFFSLPGIENGIEYRYFSRYRIEVRNSSIVTTLLYIRYTQSLQNIQLSPLSPSATPPPPTTSLTANDFATFIWTNCFQPVILISVKA